MKRQITPNNDNRLLVFQKPETIIHKHGFEQGKAIQKQVTDAIIAGYELEMYVISLVQTAKEVSIATERLTLLRAKGSLVTLSGLFTEYGKKVSAIEAPSDHINGLKEQIAAVLEVYEEVHKGLEKALAHKSDNGEYLRQVADHYLSDDLLHKSFSALATKLEGQDRAGRKPALEMAPYRLYIAEFALPRVNNGMKYPAIALELVKSLSHADFPEQAKTRLKPLEKKVRKTVRGWIDREKVTEEFSRIMTEYADKCPSKTMPLNRFKGDL